MCKREIETEIDRHRDRETQRQGEEQGRERKEKSDVDVKNLLQLTLPIL